MKRLVFDIETHPLTQGFLDATSQASRIKHAPQMRVACVFDDAANKYRFYEPEESDVLIQELISADEVISFNGTGFDLLVLKKHYGLTGRVPRKGKHIDIHLIMTESSGFRVSLDKAVRINFNEKKHTDGRAMEALTLNELKFACQSDVSQTYRLWLAHVNGNLKVPQRTCRGPEERLECGEVGSGHHMPSKCPNCHDVGSMEFIEWATEDMSDGQFSEYIVGLYGSAVCQTCGHEIDWGF